MIVKVSKTSDWEYEKQININILEELIDFVDDCTGKVVMSIDECKNIEIEIYDSYRE